MLWNLSQRTGDACPETIEFSPGWKYDAFGDPHLVDIGAGHQEGASVKTFAHLENLCFRTLEGDLQLNHLGNPSSGKQEAMLQGDAFGQCS